ncbi:protamine-2 [Meriones unguiculatus]|uniref:protamine-2 n=1 Tax=Meriones unguiculatus TaxID=10047 RepID=UPI000B4F2828|nr:protamine-2 [Meriones unguiculatus]
MVRYLIRSPSEGPGQEHGREEQRQGLSPDHAEDYGRTHRCCSYRRRRCCSRRKLCRIHRRSCRRRRRCCRHRRRKGCRRRRRCRCRRCRKH